MTVGTTRELEPAGSFYDQIDYSRVSWKSGNSSIMKISPPGNDLYCMSDAYLAEELEKKYQGIRL